MTLNPEGPPLLIDTHVWLWEIGSTGQLSRIVRREIRAAVQEDRLSLSAMSVWEISLLTSRGKLELGRPAMAWIAEARTRSRITIVPVSPEIAIEAGDLPGGFRSDPADQIIVATARVTGATLVTRDRRILDYAARGYLTVVRA